MYNNFFNVYSEAELVGWYMLIIPATPGDEERKLQIKDFTQLE